MFYSFKCLLLKGKVLHFMWIASHLHTIFEVIHQIFGFTNGRNIENAVILTCMVSQFFKMNVRLCYSLGPPQRCSILAHDVMYASTFHQKIKVCEKICGHLYACELTEV